MGNAIHQVLIKIVCPSKFCSLKLSKHYITLNVVCVGWIQPRALQCTAAVSQPLSVSLSIPVLGRWPQFVSVHCSYLIRLCILVFSAQLHMVGCTDLSGLDLPQFSKEHTANEETVPSLATALSGAALGPKPELGFKGAISPPGLPRSRHRSFPPSTLLEGKSRTGQRGRLRLSPARFDRRTDGEEGCRNRACIWKCCCTEHYC